MDELSRSTRDLTPRDVSLDDETREMTRARDTYIGDYRVDVRIGDGGMGIVYKASDPRLERFVAIKVLKEQLAFNHQYLDRLGREAKLLASVSHPSIVQVYGFEEHGRDSAQLPYLVMEYVDGESIESRLARQGKIPLQEAIRVARQAAEGLQAAQQRGIVHRDVKPSNLLVDSGGRVKLVDFGLAKVVDQPGGLTTEGVVLGTPQYISPEQGTGETADHRSDMYSLGATLYHMVTGEAAFRGDSHGAIIYAHVHHAPKPPHQVNPELSEAVSQVVGKLLAKSPDDRYDTYDELIEDLGRLEAGQAPARTTGETARATYRSAEGQRRRRERLLWSVTVVALTLSAILGGLLLANRPESLPGAQLARFVRAHPGSADRFLDLDFRSLAREKHPDVWLERLFDWRGATTAGAAGPALSDAGLVATDWRGPLIYRHEVAGLRRVVLRGVSLEAHASLGVTIASSAGSQVRSLTLTLAADRPAREPLTASRHNWPVPISGVGETLPLESLPPLSRRRFHVELELAPAGGDATRVSVRVEDALSAATLARGAARLEGTDWSDGVVILNPQSFRERFSASVESLLLLARQVVGAAHGLPVEPRA